jgi:hypothetical protein
MSFLTALSLILCSFCGGLYLGNTLSDKKYSAVLERYVTVGNTKIVNCYEIIYGKRMIDNDKR